MVTFTWIKKNWIKSLLICGLLVLAIGVFNIAAQIAKDDLAR